MIFKKCDPTEVDIHKFTLLEFSRDYKLSILPNKFTLLEFSFDYTPFSEQFRLYNFVFLLL